MSLSVTLGKIDETSVGQRAKPETGEKPTKKASLPGFGNEALKRPRRDLNPQPPDRQSGDDEFQPVSLSLVTETGEPVSPCVSPIGRVSETVVATPNRPAQGDFAAALTMIAALPLSDDEKAEAVRRLLSARA